MPYRAPDQIAQEFITEGRRQNIAPRGIVICIATGLVESNLCVYANAKVPGSLDLPHDKVGSDGLSVGPLQQQVKRGATGEWWWGPVDVCQDPTGSARLFYQRLAATNYATATTDKAAGDIAQQVQKSAYPDRYAQRMSEAQRIYDRLTADLSVKTPPKSEIGGSVAPPNFRELDYMTGGGRSNRSRPPVNWLLHTEEGNSTAEGLARFCNGANNVSYHYTVRDGIVCDVVDTDYASWSVLDANSYTINLCFAGSRAGWSRGDWLARENDIRIAAYLAVQDCRKYGIPTIVNPGPNYPKGAAPGISDHRWVTKVKVIGTHTDVGNGFPWDRFTQFVNEYAGTAPAPNNGGFLMALTDAQQTELYQKVNFIFDQLTGPGGGFKGWEQGGGRTLYDLTAASAAKQGVPGTRDTKAK
ncbi:N-acetylmuramoyl-L-alanine amidase [Tsukamurella tyrosinosolvens]|uniref:N-acetylmuramoyl-L-alanine amidase n=1 Tax=Tsukamurella tyrosinosolvens TaxID=57704 RepID=UPI002DD42590|nr:N-acetylmuramoyl-L-alanine amidase [Tsukamurella tyrosinosolvens]MEC4616175.1 N-acetylmuramoyl-L-alanine amidase [Tsukamurella tyrosinosolvens]